MRDYQESVNIRRDAKTDREIDGRADRRQTM